MKSQKRKDSPLAVAVASALAGASGGVTAMGLIYPLDIIRCRLQAEADASTRPPLSTHQRRQLTRLPSLNDVPQHVKKPLARIREEREEHSSCESGSEAEGGMYNMDGSFADMSKMEKSGVVSLTKVDAGNGAGLNARRTDRTMLGCARRIVDEEGVSALYRAMGSSLTGIFLSDISYFFIVSFLKQATYGRREVTATANLKVSAIGGLVVVLLTTPYWTAQTQLMLQKQKRQCLEAQNAALKWMSDPFIARDKKRTKRDKRKGKSKESGKKTNVSSGTVVSGTSDRMPEGEVGSDPLTTTTFSRGKKKEEASEMRTTQKSRNYIGIIDAITSIYSSKGLYGLYKGLGPALLLVSNPIIQFVSYEWIVSFLKRVKHVRRLSSFEYFICGAVAKAVATYVTYPLQVMKTMLQKRDSAFATMYECARYLYGRAKAGDFGTLYSGLTAKLFQTVSNAAIKFMIYENVRVAILSLMRVFFASRRTLSREVAAVAAENQ